MRGWILGAAAMLMGVSVMADTLAQRLLKEHEQIRTLSCEIRKDRKTDSATVRMLSRVFFERPDRLHVENVTPVARRIVCDGQTFYSYIDGDPRGFSRPVAQLDEEMTLQLRKVPGTADDHLMRLADAPEDDLEPTADHPVRKGYAAGSMYTVLSLDATGRLVRVEFFRSSDMAERTGEYTYGAFHEALPGIWIPCLHQGSVTVNGVEVRETSRIDNPTANEPISPALFEPAPFFKNVKFVDSFEAIYR